MEYIKDLTSTLKATGLRAPRELSFDRILDLLEWLAGADGQPLSESKSHRSLLKSRRVDDLVQRPVGMHKDHKAPGDIMW